MSISDTAAKTTLFISYSRKDSAVVDTLVKTLEGRGYDVRIDRSDIAKGEEWRKRIVDLIIDSTLVVFVISPASLTSPVCRDEVDLTKRLGKRIVPLMWRNPQGHAGIPEGLAERDWVSFETEFEAALDKLERAINLDDVLWRREHAQWLKRATDWDRNGRLEGSLMRAGEITAAQSWANRRPQIPLAIPDVVTDFLNASLAKEERDREELLSRERRISASFQRLVGEEAGRAIAGHRFGSAMRIALAAEPIEDERKRGITSEPTRHAYLAMAAQSSLCLVCLSGK